MTDLTQQVEEARKKARRNLRLIAETAGGYTHNYAPTLDRLIRLERAEAVHARARPHEDFWPHQYPAERAQLGCAELEAAIKAIQGGTMTNDTNWQEFKLDGFVSKADGTDFTPKEARDLMDALFEMLKARGMGFGGRLGFPGMFDDEEHHDQ